MQREFYTYAQLAERFGVTRQTIFNWIAAGRLPPPIKVSGRVVFWRRETLEQWLEEQEQAAMS